MKTLLSSLRLLVVLTVLTGGLYPLAVWSVGRLAFRDRAEGSLVVRDGIVVGSALLAQKTTDPRYFSPRPSAGDYATVASGASNLAWTSSKLAVAVTERRAALVRLFHTPNDNWRQSANWSRSDPAAVGERTTARSPWLHEISGLGGTADLPADFLTASGSGLDPELSPAAVRLQAARVAAARKLTPAQQHALDGLIARQVEGGQFSPDRINVLRLNLALDSALPSP
jgi:K+-transporting ATPase ATPase C chain